jgi:hypothetical protein
MFPFYCLFVLDSGFRFAGPSALRAKGDGRRRCAKGDGRGGTMATKKGKDDGRR